VDQPASQNLEQLRERLHQANEHFHECRLELEEILDGSQYRHVERATIAADHLREAEKEVEQVEEQIRQLLAAPADSAHATGTPDSQTPKQRPPS